MPVVLQVEDLKTYFQTYRGLVKAVDGVTFHVNEREIIGLVGESGCGKSVSMMSVMQLIASPPGKIVGGRVIFEGQDLLKFDSEDKRMRAVRGGKIAIIFQEPMTSLNPVLTVCRQMTEMLEVHLQMDSRTAREKAIELLKLVEIPDAKSRIDDYPYQFSGGMRQRVMIAMALSCNPRIIIADEPTTAVDVTTQAQLLELMKNMVTQLNASLVIITHNLGVVARYAQRIYVMYAGRIVESGSSDDIFITPRHPYTIGLLNSVPRLNEEEGSVLVPIPGLPPNLINMPPTCAFLKRCTYAGERCRLEPWPEMRSVDGGDHQVRCYVDTREKR
jgi:oligopeptide/dipeptide ABC transporter ATP-binding protein